MQKAQYIAIVGSMPKLTLSDSFKNPDIRITVGVKGADGRPRNASWVWDGPKFQPYGLSLRIYASDRYVGAIVSGGEIDSSDPRQYRCAACALETLQKRVAAMNESRGRPSDPAEIVGRYLEAAGIERAAIRPDSDAKREWLNEGEWNWISIGALVSVIRDHSKDALEAERTRQAA